MAENQVSKELKQVYYIIGIVAGLFIGVIANQGLFYVLVGGVIGFLFAVWFINTRAKSSYDNVKQNF